MLINMDKIIKTFIRVMFIAASLSMVIANFPKGSFALLASVLFLVGNVLTLIVNFKKVEKKIVKSRIDSGSNDDEVKEILFEKNHYDGSFGTYRTIRSKSK